MQTTSEILMIRPVNFGFNPETAVNNAFQVPGKEIDAQENALAEFDRFVALLREYGISVTVINDTPEPHTPDSIFPNNWVSFHSDGNLIYYPMYAENRRLERKQLVINRIEEKFKISRETDLTGYTSRNLFLEGTGSMVLDRDHHIAYACLSPRTSQEVMDNFCAQTGYQSLTFIATDERGKQIYHTNVMMCIADRYAVVCLESVRKPDERERLINAIADTKKELITITMDQMNHFAGNMLQVQNGEGEKLLVMSSQAFDSLDKQQVDRLEKYNRIIHSLLTTIETNGGGSARCMMAEIHLPKL